MEKWRKQGIWFHLFEQIYVPLVGLRYKVVIYPYNSAAFLSVFHRGSLLIVHDFIAYRRRLPGYSKASAKAVRLTQCFYELSRRNVGYITREVARQARFIHKFTKSRTFILPNTFVRFREIAATVQCPEEVRGKFILLCTGKVPTKDLKGALCLYKNSAVARGYKLLVIGLAGDAEFVERIFDSDFSTRHFIEVLPIVSINKLVELYKSATAVWVHSVSEGFGRNLAEALACRAKVIASDIPPFRKQAIRSRNVYLYRNGDQSSFEKMLNEAVSKSRVEEECESYAKDLAQAFHDLLAP
jgi:glycosyltransferase involved in cell wall biosynthesis